MVTVQAELYIYCADYTKSIVWKRPAHCDAIFNGRMPVTVKVNELLR